MFDDEEIKKKTSGFEPPKLDEWSVDELKHYVLQLQSEITRVETEISKKDAHKANIDKLFGAQN